MTTYEYDKAGVMAAYRKFVENFKDSYKKLSKQDKKDRGITVVPNLRFTTICHGYKFYFWAFSHIFCCDFRSLADAEVRRIFGKFRRQIDKVPFRNHWSLALASFWLHRLTYHYISLPRFILGIALILEKEGSISHFSHTTLHITICTDGSLLKRYHQWGYIQLRKGWCSYSQ